MGRIASEGHTLSHGPGRGGATSSPRRLIAALRRQALPGAAVALVVALSCAALLMRMGPLYTGEALVLVEPRGQAIEETPREALLHAAGDEMVDSQVEIIRSDAVLLRALAGLETPVVPKASGLPERIGALLAGADMRASPARTQDRLVETARENLRVRRRGLTFVIEIAYADPSPERAAEIANAIAEAHVAARIAARIADAREARAVLERRMARIEADRERLLADLATLSLEARPAASGATCTAPREGPDVALLPVAGLVSSDTAGFAQTLVPRDPIAARIAALRPHRLTARLLACLTALAPDALSPDQQRRLDRLEAETRAVAEVQADVSRRLQRLRAGADAHMADARLLSPALPPHAPGDLSGLMILALSGLLGLGAGMGLGTLREAWLTGLTEPDDVERAAGLPLVAALPAAARNKVDLVAARPLSPHAEAVRRWSRALEAHAPAEGGALVVAVAPCEADGSGASAGLSLARRIAGAGRRAVIVDLDLRRPALGLLAGLADDPDADLGRYLRDASGPRGLPLRARDVLRRDPLTSLRIAASYESVPGETDRLIEGARLTDLLARLRRAADVIVLNLPPAGRAVDAAVALRHADVATLIVRHAVTRADALDALVADLHRADAPPPMLCVLDGAPGATRRGYGER